MPPPASPRMGRSTLLRRLLPLCAVVGLGLWLQRSTDLFPRTRQILWEFPDDYAAIQQADLQIHDAQGALLVRKVVSLARGMPSEVVGDLTLSAGEYQAWAFLRRAPGGPEQVLKRPVRVASDGMVVVSLRSVR